MREEQQLLGVLLKSQPLGEADSLVTWFTRERGKIRTMVVSARKPRSKLNYVLLPGSVVAFRITQRLGYPSAARLIQAVPIEVYVRDFTEGRALVLQWLQEIILRATPDEQTAEDVYTLIVEAFTVLAHSDFKASSVPVLMLGVLQRLCGILGFGIQSPMRIDTSYFFNMSAGGFVAEALSGDDWFLVTEEVSRFALVGSTPLMNLVLIQPAAVDERLVDLATHFFEYHIERVVRSGRLFGAILQ